MYLVERYVPGLSRSDLLAALERLRKASGERGKEASVRYLGSTIVLEDEACFCHFEGPSEAAVAEANERVAAPFDRIVPAIVVFPEPPGRRESAMRARCAVIIALAAALGSVSTTPAFAHQGGHQGGCAAFGQINRAIGQDPAAFGFPTARNLGDIVSSFAVTADGQPGVGDVVETVDHAACG